MRGSPESKLRGTYGNNVIHGKLLLWICSPFFCKILLISNVWPLNIESINIATSRTTSIVILLTTNTLRDGKQNIGICQVRYPIHTTNSKIVTLQLEKRKKWHHVEQDKKNVSVRSKRKHLPNMRSILILIQWVPTTRPWERGNPRAEIITRRAVDKQMENEQTGAHCVMGEKEGE